MIQNGLEKERAWLEGIKDRGTLTEEEFNKLLHLAEMALDLEFLHEWQRARADFQKGRKDEYMKKTGEYSGALFDILTSAKAAVKNGRRHHLVGLVEIAKIADSALSKLD